MQIHVRLDSGFAIDKCYQSAHRMRAAMMPRQRCDLKKADSPAYLRNRLVAPIVIRTLDMRVPSDPEIDCAVSVLLVEVFEEVFEDVSVRDEAEIIGVLILDKVIEVR